MTTNQPTARGPRAHLIEGWTNIWNGDLTEADRICSSEIRVHFGGKAIGTVGDRVRTAADLATLIEDFRSTRPGLRYRLVEAATTNDRGVCVWNASLGEVQVGGIDSFTFGDQGITHVYSVTGERPMNR